MRWFGMRASRAGGIIGVVALAVVIETAVLHLLLAPRHPYGAWALTAASLYALWWIAADYRALAEAVVGVDAGGITLRIGRRVTGVIPRDAVAAIGPPRLMPPAGWPKGRLNATKPAAPNVEIIVRAPVTVTVLGRPRAITELALRIDDPAALVAAWQP